MADAEHNISLLGGLPGASPELRLIMVEDDAMEPTLRRGDAVCALPVSAYSGEGVYLIDKGYPAVCRVSPGPRSLLLSTDNKLYGPPTEYTKAQFNEFVIGKVGAFIRVVNGDVLEGRP